MVKKCYLKTKTMRHPRLLQLIDSIGAAMDPRAAPALTTATAQRTKRKSCW
jgi:hypothetical protein